MDGEGARRSPAVSFNPAVPCCSSPLRSVALGSLVPSGNGRRVSGMSASTAIAAWPPILVARDRGHGSY
jgi:hypothetical protein